jgi:hypothetical protein
MALTFSCGEDLGDHLADAHLCRHLAGVLLRSPMSSTGRAQASLADGYRSGWGNPCISRPARRVRERRVGGRACAAPRAVAESTSRRFWPGDPQPLSVAGQRKPQGTC